jgi:Putative adhesin
MGSGYVADAAGAPSERAWARLRRRTSTWTLVVAASVFALAAAAAAMGVLWLVTSGSRSVSYPFSGPLLRVEIEVGSGDVQILGGGRSSVHVRKTERFAYGHSPQERLDLDGGVLTIASQCASLIVGTCSSDYELAVPDNVALTIRATDGDVRLDGYRGSADVATTRGRIVIDRFCGFLLQATARTGDIDVDTECASERLDLRSDSGDVRAVVPGGRYRIDAGANDGRVAVRGVVHGDDAPWEIQALSGSGDVTIVGRS